MKKKYTLRKNYEFRNILSKGRYYRGNLIDIYIKNNKKNDNYIGIAVGVKVAKAVKRNRIKRLIRESYRLLVKNTKLQKGNNIVFLWKKANNIEDANLKDIKKDMINIFKDSNILIDLDIGEI